MTDNTQNEDAVTHVVFSYPMEKDIEVPVDEAFAWRDQQEKHWKPTKVIWQNKENGGFSYAKGWWQLVDGEYRLQRVGAGAYGDQVILKRDFGDTK